jgi:hypothetical protein
MIERACGAADCHPNNSSAATRRQKVPRDTAVGRGATHQQKNQQGIGARPGPCQPIGASQTQFILSPCTQGTSRISLDAADKTRPHDRKGDEHPHALLIWNLGLERRSVGRDRVMVFLQPSGYRTLGKACALLPGQMPKNLALCYPWLVSRVIRVLSCRRCRVGESVQWCIRLHLSITCGYRYVLEGF